MRIEGTSSIRPLQCIFYLAILGLLGSTLMGCTMPDQSLPLVRTATSTLAPSRVALPVATGAPTNSPTATPSSTLVPTETPTRTPTSTTVAPTPTTIPSTVTPVQASNPPTLCGTIPGTVRYDLGHFNFQERMVTFCNADIAQIDVCEPHNIEYCRCNSTSGCCQKPRDGELIVGDQITTLYYPAGTSSFQASIPPKCRSHNSDRVLIIGFNGPLP